MAYFIACLFVKSLLDFLTVRYTLFMIKKRKYFILCTIFVIAKSEYRKILSFALSSFFILTIEHVTIIIINLDYIRDNLK